jgi:hypothetical protein
VRSDIGRPGCRTRQSTRVTTLLEAAGYPVPDLAELYRRRWQVDTSLAHLQTTRQLDVLHGKPVSGVLQEWMVLALIDNLVRLVRSQAAGLQQSAVQRISCLDALRWRSAPNTAIPFGALRVTPPDRLVWSHASRSDAPSPAR